MPKKVSLLTLRIALVGAAVPVWRRVRVPVGIALEELHFVFQVSMGWTNSHLHAFDFGGVQYGFPDDEEPIFQDESGVSLKKALGTAKSFGYLYDFGDSWEHSVAVESVLKMDAVWDFPVCLAGAGACPPEDVGGRGGYENFCDIISDPEHEEHHETLIWAGGVFDPYSFDVNRVSRELRGLCWPVDAD